MVYLLEGHVTGHTLPLNRVTEERWRAGHLRRVNADGTPWQGGDEFAVLPGTPPQPGQETAREQPPLGSTADDTAGPEDGLAVPKLNAPRRDWAAYATSLGAASAEEAEQMTRGELIERCTPPELQPGTGG